MGAAASPVAVMSGLMLRCTSRPDQTTRTWQRSWTAMGAAASPVVVMSGLTLRCTSRPDQTTRTWQRSWTAMGAASSPVAVMRTTTVSAPPSASGFCALPAPARVVVSGRNACWTGMSLRDMRLCPTSSTAASSLCTGLLAASCLLESRRA